MEKIFHFRSKNSEISPYFQNSNTKNLTMPIFDSKVQTLNTQDNNLKEEEEENLINFKSFIHSNKSKFFQNLNKNNKFETDSEQLSPQKFKKKDENFKKEENSSKFGLIPKIHLSENIDFKQNIIKKEEGNSSIQKFSNNNNSWRKSTFSNYQSSEKKNDDDNKKICRNEKFNNEVKEENPFKHKWRCLIFCSEIKQNIFKNHINLVYRGLVYSKKSLKSPSEKFLLSKQVNLCDSKS